LTAADLESHVLNQVRQDGIGGLVNWFRKSECLDRSGKTEKCLLGSRLTIWTALGLSMSCHATAPSGSISLEFLTTIGDSVGDNLLPSPPGSMARDSKGRFYLTFPFRGEEPPMVFGPDGRFLQRLGRVGDGPGESRRPNAVFIGAADSIYILDRSLARLTVLTSDFELARTATFPMFLDVTRLSSGDFAISVMGDSRTTFGLRRLNAAIKPMTSFGTVESPCPPLVCGSTDPRALSPGQHDDVWAVWRFFRYRVSHYRADGREDEFAPKVSWYVPYDRPGNPAPDAPPDPILTAVGEDADGRIWVLGRTAQPEWRSAVGAPTVAEGQKLHKVSGRLYDGVIEVLDQEGKVIAHYRFEGDPRFWLPGSLIASQRSNENGVLYIDIYHAHYSATTK
jgi:hypothetical protein